MTIQEFNYYSYVYSPLIKTLIDQNVDFYRSNSIKKWRFDVLVDVSVVASCDRKTNLIRVNLESVIKAVQDNDVKTIEYFLLHEIRHHFQHEIISDYKNGVRDLPIGEEKNKKWIEEDKHHKKAIDDKGIFHEEYYFQDFEYDAYLYAFSVMKYKYNYTRKELFVPSVYGEEFDKEVDDWIEQFKSEGIESKFFR